MHKDTFQTEFDQLFSTQAYIALLSYANFKKKQNFLSEHDQLIIAKGFNRRFSN